MATQKGRNRRARESETSHVYASSAQSPEQNGNQTKARTAGANRRAYTSRQRTQAVGNSRGTASQREQARPHQRTGDVPRVEGVRYLDSTGPIKSATGQERVRAERRIAQSQAVPKPTAHRTNSSTRMAPPTHKRARDASGRTMGLPRIEDGAPVVRAEDSATRRPRGDSRSRAAGSQAKRVRESRPHERREGSRDHVVNVQRHREPAASPQRPTREHVVREPSSREHPSHKRQARRGFPLPVAIGAGLLLVAVVLVLVAWGCSRRAADERAAQEAAQQEQAAQEQAQQPASDLDGVSPGTYYIVLVNETNASLCLSATGNEDDDYTVVELGATGGSPQTQRFILNIVDSSSCTLSTADGLYLDAGDGSAGPGLRLYANEKNDGDGQLWQIEHATGGYRITSKSTGRAIEAPDASQGTELVTDETDDANTNQVFRFVPVEETAAGTESGSAS